MSVTVLGPAGVRHDDDVAAIPSRRQRQLLGVLAMHTDGGASIDRIIDLLWLDEVPSDPAATVRTIVSRLRRTLDPVATIETVPAGYRLVVTHGMLDIDELRALARRGEDTDDAQRLIEVERCDELWRGDPLPDLEGPSIEALRQELRSLRSELLEERAALLEVLGRHVEAAAAAERLVADHPHREGPVVVLVRALYALGRQADALAAIRDLRRRLVDDLGVDPSTGIGDLEAAVLGHRLTREPRTTTPARPSRPMSQRIQFCTAQDGTNIAYATSGSGPWLVKAANWMTHLDYDWTSPVWRHWMTALSSNHTLLRYDERGCGLSDRDVRFSFDAWVDDLEVVVDAAGVDRFPLLGVSQGAAVAIAYAVRHPERVSHLVLWGGYGLGRTARATTDEERRAAELNVELARVGWGTGDATFRQVFTSQFMPDGTREQWEQFNELQRQTCSAENAARFMRVFGGIDVLDLARDVRVPTLLMHSRHEVRVPLSASTTLAGLIPDSQLMPLPSRNHILDEDEPAWRTFVTELEAFIATD
jgi:pimeloyl-ACP methyl ester carboxylesterase/DNA-binding SARP family transcriptional activator